MSKQALSFISVASGLFLLLSLTTAALKNNKLISHSLFSRFFFAQGEDDHGEGQERVTEQG